MTKSQTEGKGIKREIKFRVFAGYKMEYFELGDDVPYYYPDENSPAVKYKPVMQYTGLKDKNGKEIYEGDIVEQRNSVTGITNYYEIVWSNDDCGFIGKSKKDSLFNGLGIISKELEITGNIYEIQF